jgi:hypothetical protein
MTYTITQPFKNVCFLGTDEVHMEGINLMYCEAFNFSGLQCINQDNHKAIIKKCEQIADLIREIEELNK